MVDQLKAFYAAARKVETMISTLAETGGDLDVCDSQAAPIYAAVDRLEKRSNGLGDEVWETCKRIRRSVAPAVDAARAVRISRRTAQIAAINESMRKERITRYERGMLRW